MQWSSFVKKVQELQKELKPSEYGGDHTLQENAASVLMLFAASGKSSPSTQTQLLITKRTETVETHKGQYAFPGGMGEAGENAIDTALRETEEEVGIDPRPIQVIGELTGFRIPTSGFWVTPIVALHPEKLENISLKINPVELESAFWVPFEKFSAPGVYRLETWEREGRSHPIHSFQVGESRIWGATGYMIRNFMDRIFRL